MGVAVIVSVYAAGAVPGQFVPGLQAAFLTSAGFAAVALLVTATVLRTPRADRWSRRVADARARDGRPKQPDPPARQGRRTCPAPPASASTAGAGGVVVAGSSRHWST